MNRPLAELFRYNKWANLELLDSCSSLTDDELDAQTAATSGSIRTLLMHIARGEQTFILRTRGRQNEGELTRTSAWPGFGKLREIVEGAGDELIAIAEQLDDDVEVRLLYMDKSYRYPTSLFLVHAMEHGVEHRTDVKVALVQRGIASRDLDGWAYAAAAGYGQAVPYVPQAATDHVQIP